jgi:hypothetical protein
LASAGEGQMPGCCGVEHQWDRHKVESTWLPPTLRCFVVGENPGDTTSQYFYERPVDYRSDEVAVRRALLRGLHQYGLIHEATLEGFKGAGFLFDHAIRCQLPSAAITSERQKAMRYVSPRVERTWHLRPWLAQAKVVWVMGHLASNGVANATTEFPKQRRKISKQPYPGEIACHSRFFLSEYLSWRTEVHAPAFCQAFKDFALQRHVFDDVASG